MKKLNFKEFDLPTGISRREHRTVDAREAIADLLYTHVNGIKAHRLAFKIYESEGATAYSEEETDLIRQAVEAYCLPGVIDGLAVQLSEELRVNNEESGVKDKECVTHKDE